MYDIFAYLIATIIPVFFLFLIYRLDLYRIGEYRLVILCFIAGGMSFVLAYFLNPLTVKLGWVDVQNMSRFSAPVLEEIIKASFLLFLIRRPSFSYFVDGAIYGFSIGIGFAVFENYSYLLNSTSGLELALARVISTNLIHASASALVGSSFGLSRFDNHFRKSVLLSVGLFLAISLHMIFNNLVVSLNLVNGLIIIGMAVGMGLGASEIIYLIIKRGLNNERQWIEENLGKADGVTGEEARVVKQISSLEIIIRPFMLKFGQKKAAQIEKLLLIQAKLGIYRKTIHRELNESERQNIEKEMEELRLEMNHLRKSLGIYPMLYLRHIFPENAGNLWNRLEIAVLEQQNESSRSASGNVWNQLNRKLNKQKQML